MGTKAFNNVDLISACNYTHNFLLFKIQELKVNVRGFPGGAVVENLPASSGDTGSSPGLGRSRMPRSN